MEYHFSFPWKLFLLKWDPSEAEGYQAELSPARQNMTQSEKEIGSNTFIWDIILKERADGLIVNICRFQNNLKLIFSQGEFLEIFSG